MERSATGRSVTSNPDLNVRSVMNSGKKFVILPSDELRGIRPPWMLSSSSEYRNSKDIENLKTKATIPFRKGTLVWFLPKETRFAWYIPAIIEDYIVAPYGGEITGYSIAIDWNGSTEDYTGKMQKIKEGLKNVSPASLIERWNEKPIEAPFLNLTLQNSIYRHDSNVRFVESKVRYGQGLGYEGPKQDGIGPGYWGVTLQQLKDVIQHPNFNKTIYSYGKKVSGGMNFYELVEKVIKPETEGSGLGYAVLKNRDNPQRITKVVSHTWGADYETFVKCLEDSGEIGPFFISAFAVYQHDDMLTASTEEKSLAKGAFVSALKQVSMMIVVATPDCDIYKRLWIIYEMFMAIVMNIPVTMAHYVKPDEFQLNSKPYQHYDAALDNVNQRINSVEAVCTVPEDQEMIWSHLHKIGSGSEIVDDVMYWVKITYLIKCFMHASSTDLEKTYPVPVGICTVSCVRARLDAGIAKVIKTWNERRNRRSEVHESLSIHIVEEKLEVKKFDYNPLQKDGLCGCGILSVFS